MFQINSARVHDHTTQTTPPLTSSQHNTTQRTHHTANLGAATLDYGFAGDYDYSIITALVDDRSFYAYVDTYDDDGGQLAAVPGTGAVTSRTATKLDDERQRCIHACFACV